MYIFARDTALAPGEQVVLEYHIWDKSTFKSEKELTEELELRLSSKLTQRDTKELVGELATQSGAKLSEQLNLTIPIPLGSAVIPVGVNAGGELSQQLNTKLTATLGSVTERTDEAAASLKNQHKVRIEVARDQGRESKQTRTIANTNRCHTLNCHYFEILSHYHLKTDLKRVVACMLVDLPRVVVSRKWVLCNEDILRKVLIDPVYLPGFEAAKLLEVAEVYDSLQAQAVGAGDGGSVGTQRGREFDGLRGAILDAWDELQQAARDLERAASKLMELNFDLVGKAGAIGDLETAIPMSLYVAMLAANADALNALKALENSKSSTDGLEGLRRMFASVTHRDYQYSIVKSVVAEGLDALGVPSPIVEFLLFSGSLLIPLLGVSSIVEFVADDAGLHGAVKAAEDRVRGATQSPAGQVATGVEGAAAISPVLGFGGLNMNAGGISNLQRAEAQVEFARLACHIRDYCSHYRQAVWLRMHPDERSQYLANLGLGALTTGELVGFVDGKGAYVLTNANFLGNGADVGKLLDEVLQGASKPSETTLQLPTGGTVMEAYRIGPHATRRRRPSHPSCRPPARLSRPRGR